MCPAPVAGGPSTTWDDCNVGLDPTKNGGDLLWATSLVVSPGLCSNPWIPSVVSSGPTGDTAVEGTCSRGANFLVDGVRLNGSGALVGSTDIHQGGTGSLSISARFGRHKDYAVFTSRDKYGVWEQHLESDDATWQSMSPAGFDPWDSDVLGNVFVAADVGYLNNSNKLGSIQFPAAGKYLIRTGSPGTTFQAGFNGGSLTADQTGGVYRSGALPGPLDLGCGPMTPASPSSGYLARLDGSLTCVYSHALPVVPSILASTSGAAILSAKAVTTLDLGCGALPAAPGGSTFVTGIDGAGACVFGKSFPSAGLTVALDPAGRVVLSGFVGPQPIDLGGGPLAAIGSNDLVIAELDASGNHLWSARFGGAAASFGSGKVSTSENGNVYLLTSFSGGIDFGGGVVNAAASDTVVASFTPSGQLRFARALSITGAMSSAIDGCGSLVVVSAGPSFNPGCGEVFPPPMGELTHNLAIARFAP